MDKPKTSQELFIEEYNKLVEKYKCAIMANPAYIKRDDGSFSTVIQMSVGELPKEK